MALLFVDAVVAAAVVGDRPLAWAKRLRLVDLPFGTPCFRFACSHGCLLRVVGRLHLGTRCYLLGVVVAHLVILHMRKLRVI